MIVPLSYFIEKPFQNWTRESSALIGSAFSMSITARRSASSATSSARSSSSSKNWDGNVVNLQVTDAKERTIELRAS